MPGLWRPLPTEATSSSSPSALRRHRRPGQGSRCFGREASDLLGCAELVSARSERLTREAQRHLRVDLARQRRDRRTRGSRAPLAPPRGGRAAARPASKLSPRRMNSRLPSTRPSTWTGISSTDEARTRSAARRTLSGNRPARRPHAPGTSSSGRREPSSSAPTAAELVATAHAFRERRASSATRATTTSAPVARPPPRPRSAWPRRGCRRDPAPRPPRRAHRGRPRRPDLPLFWTHSHPDPAEVWSRGKSVGQRPH